LRSAAASSNQIEDAAAFFCLSRQESDLFRTAFTGYQRNWLRVSFVDRSVIEE